MNIESQKQYLTSVYRDVFQKQETGSVEEIDTKIRKKVGDFFAPTYQQTSNTLSYNYETFICHLKQVNSRGEANFAIKFLSHETGNGQNRVLVRVVVTSQEDHSFESGVLSYWTFSDNGKLQSCFESLFSISDDDGCGDNEDPTTWKYDVKV